MRILLALALAATALAGCSAKAPAASGPAAHDHAAMVAQMHGAWNYTTPDPGGAPFTRDYTGMLTPQQAANGGVPLGFSPPNFQTCCYVAMMDAPDLLALDQLVSMRVTLTWTNTQSDRAGLDAAICVPWHCIDFNRGGDESLADGPHQDVLSRVTSGRQDFLDQGLAYQVGVRFSNAALTNGLAYSVHVELIPVGNGLAPGDAYLIHVADNATLTGHLAAPMADGDGFIGMMVYGSDDRPLHWIDVHGKDGETFQVNLTAGTYVVAVLDYDHAFVRLSTDREPSSVALRPLQVEFGQADLATVTDSQAHDGTIAYAAAPGMMGDFPWFLYGEGVAAQDLFGLQPTSLGGANLTFSSSHGLIAGVDTSQLSYQELGQQSCLNCNGRGSWHPGNYLDDDGTYDIKWHSQGGTGTFVMFTQRYVR
jgi:hypothetical protein